MPPQKSGEVGSPCRLSAGPPNPSRKITRSSGRPRKMSTYASAEQAQRKRDRAAQRAHDRDGEADSGSRIQQTTITRMLSQSPSARAGNDETALSQLKWVSRTQSQPGELDHRAADHAEQRQRAAPGDHRAAERPARAATRRGRAGPPRGCQAARGSAATRSVPSGRARERPAGPAHSSLIWSRTPSLRSASTAPETRSVERAALSGTAPNCSGPPSGRGGWPTMTPSSGSTSP